jgi:hypothetical protein
MDALGNNSQPQQAVAPPEETEAAGGDGNGIGGRQPRLSMSQRTVPGVNYVGGPAYLIVAVQNRVRNSTKSEKKEVPSCAGWH